MRKITIGDVPVIILILLIVIGPPAYWLYNKGRLAGQRNAIIHYAPDYSAIAKEASGGLGKGIEQEISGTVGDISFTIAKAIDGPWMFNPKEINNVTILHRKKSWVEFEIHPKVVYLFTRDALGGAISFVRVDTSVATLDVNLLGNENMIGGGLGITPNLYKPLRISNIGIILVGGYDFDSKKGIVTGAISFGF